MLVDALTGVFLLLSGGLAGVLVAVDIAVVPMLCALPADRFVQVHRLLDPGFDPLMPRVNKVTLAAGAALVLLADGIGAKLAFAASALCIVGVAVVSEVFNVRINRRIDTWDLAAPPPEWARVRRSWGQWNRVRTAMAVGFLAAVTGTFLVWS